MIEILFIVNLNCIYFNSQWKVENMSFFLNDQEKIFLLRLARKSIRNSLTGHQPDPEKYFSDTLKTHSGAFVTLHINHDLRGCIGYVKAFKPLQEAISDLAISAAFNDPRFPTLSQEEFDDIEIEISVLTPLEKVDDPGDILVGRDGLLIKKGFYEGLLLPQVATDYHWDRDTFLAQTCQKAHLPADAWKDPQTEIFRFSAIIFSEPEFLGLPTKPDDLL